MKLPNMIKLPNLIKLPKAVQQTQQIQQVHRVLQDRPKKNPFLLIRHLSLSPGWKTGIKSSVSSSTNTMTTVWEAQMFYSAVRRLYPMLNQDRKALTRVQLQLPHSRLQMNRRLPQGYTESSHFCLVWSIQVPTDLFTSTFSC